MADILDRPLTKRLTFEEERYGGSRDPLFDREEMDILFGTGAVLPPRPPSKKQLDRDLYVYMCNRYASESVEPLPPAKSSKPAKSSLSRITDHLGSDPRDRPVATGPGLRYLNLCEVCSVSTRETRICGPYKFWRLGFTNPQKICIRVCLECLPKLVSLEEMTTKTIEGRDGSTGDRRTECFLFYGGRSYVTDLGCITDLRKFILHRTPDGSRAECDSCHHKGGTIRTTKWYWRCETYSKKVWHISCICRRCHNATRYDRTYGQSWSEAMDYIAQTVENSMRYRHGESSRVGAKISH